MPMAKSERAELRSVVKQQIKVLRAEVLQRKAELESDASDQVRAKYQQQADARDSVRHLITEIVNEANRKANDLLRENQLTVGRLEDGYDYSFFSTPRLRFDDDEERRDIQAANREIQERVRAALAILERQEADLLRELAIEAIESDEARSFLARIPTVSELVPASRLLALEAGDDRSSSGE